MRTDQELRELTAPVSVLYVEDDPDTRRQFAMILEHFFKRFAAAEDGNEAWELYRKQGYDLLITDVNMPGVNGIELVKRVCEANPGQEVVMISAENDHANMQRARELGVQEFILKPVDLDQLGGVIERACERVREKLQIGGIIDEAALRPVLETGRGANESVRIPRMAQEGDTFDKAVGLAATLSVLYVEDEEAIRGVTAEIFSQFFARVDTASDGAEAVMRLGDGAPDILITDIQMPRMNGLELIKYAKEKYPDLPVIITTAFGDQDYLISAIEMGVDRYVLKPIDEERITQVIYSVAKSIDEEKKARAYERKLLQERISRYSSRLIQSLMDSYAWPCVITREGEVTYANDSFIALFAHSSLLLLEPGEKIPEGLFDKREGYLPSLDAYDERDTLRNRLSISSPKGRKIYRVTRQSILPEKEKAPSSIYIFFDITMEEYQKLKIDHYNEMLQELVFDSRYRQPAKTGSGRQQESGAHQAAVEAEPAKKEKAVSGQTVQVLRRSHAVKTTAQVYLSTLDDDSLIQIQELAEIETDMYEELDAMHDAADMYHVRNMGLLVRKYSHQVSVLFEFGDLTYALNQLAEFLGALPDIGAQQFQRLELLLEGVRRDLFAWRTTVFIDQSAIDIHYLDSSLMSSCLQIELMFDEGADAIEGSDDLILF